MRVTARLKPGVSISQAQAAMPALFQSYRATSGNGRQHLDVGIGLGRGRCDRKFASGFPDVACRSQRRLADRVQQCRESIARALHGRQA